MVAQMGYTPKYRKITAEENAVQVLKTYEAYGAQEAKALMKHLCVEEQKEVDRMLIAKHSIVAVMKGDIGGFFGLVGLTSYAKKVAKNS